MNKEKELKIMELSLKILEDLISNVKYSSKEDLLKFTNKTIEIAEKKEDEILIRAYKLALNRLQDYSYEEILETKKMINK